MKAYILAIIAAIRIVEGNPTGEPVKERNGYSWGELCIMQGKVDDYNKLTGESITLQDCRSYAVSEKVAVVTLTHYIKAYQRRHGHLPPVVWVAKIWNPSAEYAGKVQKAFKKKK